MCDQVDRNEPDERRPVGVYQRDVQRDQPLLRPKGLLMYELVDQPLPLWDEDDLVVSEPPC